MSPISRRILGATMVAVLAIVGTMVFVTIPAYAQRGRVAECQQFASGVEPAAWMNRMITGGKTDFVQSGTQLCAW